MHTVGSRYKITGKLGSGGMSDVYAAEAQDGRLFAVKVFRREKESSFLAERFLAEAKILKTTYHPRIVRVYDFGIDAETGAPWFAMDLVAGADGTATTLEDVRRRADATDAEMRMWLGEAEDALGYLHKCGIVHRDVKLENILVDADRHVRLADFGVSRIIDGRLKSDLRVNSTFVTGETTGTRPVMGTYFYIPKEVRGGAPATPQTDFYALGVAFFRLLTGLWYEPGTDALSLLAPFPEFWRKELPKLLGVCTKDAKKARRRLVARAIVAVCATAAITLVALLSRRPASNFSTSQPSNFSTAESAWALPPSFSVPQTRRLQIGGEDGTEIGFCACPAGSFMMSGIGNAAQSFHKVTITRPFWIGRTVVSADAVRCIAATDEKRDALAAQMAAAFPDMHVACKMRGSEVDDFFGRLNMQYGMYLPDGYVFRLPTEAELEYALREGGGRAFAKSEAWKDNAKTHDALADTGIPMHERLRLLPRSQTNTWGIVTLWTDTEQAVLDTIDGEPGTETAAASIAYADVETDPLRSGALHLSRQYPFQRWLFRDYSGFVRICIGPKLTPSPIPGSRQLPTDN